MHSPGLPGQNPGFHLSGPAAMARTQTSKVHRVALVFLPSPAAEMAGPEPVNPNARAFLHGLRALGYAEGQNLILERRIAEGPFGRYGDIITELVRLKTDVIVTSAIPWLSRPKRPRSLC